MSEQHLKSLLNTLEANRWKFIEELPGDGYRISAIWAISRTDGSNRLELEFEGLDDLITLPIEKSYGCRLKQSADINLYFAPISNSWGKLLDEFMEKLNSYAS